MTTSRRAAGYLVLGLLAWLGPGCAKGPPRPIYPVRGQFLFEGRPMAGAFIVFHPLDDADPRAVRPRAHADAEGRFVLTTYSTGDGAPAGDYAVTVQWPVARPGGGDHEDDPPDRLRGRYSDPKTSGLKARVEAKANDLPPFQLP